MSRGSGGANGSYPAQTLLPKTVRKRSMSTVFHARQINIFLLINTMHWIWASIWPIITIFIFCVSNIFSNKMGKLHSIHSERVLSHVLFCFPWVRKLGLWSSFWSIKNKSWVTEIVLYSAKIFWLCNSQYSKDIFISLQSRSKEAPKEYLLC